MQINGLTISNGLILELYTPRGDEVFDSPGTYSWLCPEYVYSVNVVCVGGGSGGLAQGTAGAGGGLGWKNSIAVTPGQTYTVVVGAGGLNDGVAGTGYGPESTGGGDSYFISTSIVAGFGGAIPYWTDIQNPANARHTPGGGYVGDGGGDGGAGGHGFAGMNNFSGGGGAGGYTGTGGRGGYSLSGGAFSIPTAGTGGSAGGGYLGLVSMGSSGSVLPGGGGGVGLYGQGGSGVAAGSQDLQPNGAKGGGGGSGGANGYDGGTSNHQVGVADTKGRGGAYGGGSGGGGSSIHAGGGAGAVRIVWGANRPFPVVPVAFAQQTYTTPGTYTWTCPEDVSSVSVVAVGGGASGGCSVAQSTGTNIYAGGGGGLGWKNTISVIPGQTYTLRVGAGGLPNNPRYEFGNPVQGELGEDSYFIDATVVMGGGGRNDNTFSTYVGDGGGRGGKGPLSDSGRDAGAGGGGAGGYSGDGGNGALNWSSGTQTAGAGGGGSGGEISWGGQYSGSSATAGHGGGGVGLLGQGVSGAKAVTSGVGQGGSGGANAPLGDRSVGDSFGKGGDYGGGGGMWGQIYGSSAFSGKGGDGAIRIIWGTGAAYPGSAAGVSITTSSLDVGFITVAYSDSVSATGGSGSYTFSVLSGSLPTGLTIDNAGTITGTPTTAGTYTVVIGAADTTGTIGSKSFTMVVNEINQLYTTPGTYSWTAPIGVTSVCVVAVGGGASGSINGGGGGGGLGWKNSVTVVPGQSYTVVVGTAGTSDLFGESQNGSDSYFIDTNTVAGRGGQARIIIVAEDPLGYGGSYTGDGGGAGGRSAGGSPFTAGRFYGGGSAGGYTGAGAGGSIGSGNGLGAGLFGQGSSGSGMSYGGGRLGASETASINRSQTAGHGAVRIIWGPGKSFPNNAS